MEASLNIYAPGRMWTLIICAALVIITFIWAAWPRGRKDPGLIPRPEPQSHIQVPGWRIVDPPPPKPPLFDQDDPDTWPQNFYKDWA